MVNLTSEFVRHMPCSNCGSSDGKAIYSDGHTYCFVCHDRTGGDNDVIHSQRMTKTVHLTGSAERLQKRNISEKTNQLYQIYRDGNTLRFPYYDGSGILQGVKIKTKPKDFRYEGVSTDTLFGQHRFPTTGKRIVITEGELDAASCYEAMPGWPMVSLPHGAASAKKDLQKQIPLLQGYKEIVLLFDSDEAGRKAAKDAAGVLPPGKVKIARIEPYKDPSEALQANDAEAIRKAIWNAEEYRPDGIIEGKTLQSLVTTPLPPSDHDYPFRGLQDKLHGIRYQELTTITSGSGQGKSTFCRQLAVNLLTKGERVGYLALEESNRRTALGLMSTAVGKSLHIGEHERTDLEEHFRDTIANWNLYLFDGFGSFDPDVIYNRIEYLASGLECRIIFLDHLSILLSGLDGDERRTIDITMTRLRSLVERTGIALFLVSHLRRSNNDRTSHEEGGKVSLSQLRGSAGIAQLSDQVIALERNQQSTDERDIATLRIIKNRYSGETGFAGKIKFDLETSRFTDYETTESPIFNPTTDF
jgi:twinkle protein